ncbi:MAG: response regulator [Chitinophagaceae bacterium]|nr:response regulator [Chitinophagaceae bacterium]
MQGSKTILYVDDDEDDRELLSEAINEINPAVNVVFAVNGIEAMDYLNNTEQTNGKFPCLVVLDINMPYLDGRQTFLRIKKDPKFQKLPVIIFTSSKNPNDRALFQDQGVELITKPNDIHYLTSIANHMLSHC